MSRAEIEYDTYKVKAFLDTNIILEGRALADLPWQEIGYGAALVSVTRFLHREWREGLLTEFGDPVTQLANRDL